MFVPRATAALISVIALALAFTLSESKDQRERPFMCGDPYAPIERAICGDPESERIYMAVEKQFVRRLEELAGKRGEDQLYSSQRRLEAMLAVACLPEVDSRSVRGATRSCLRGQLPKQ